MKKLYFTVMVKEGETSNLKTLTEKLTDGYYIGDRIEVGRSTLLVLEKRVYEEIERTVSGSLTSRYGYDQEVEAPTPNY